MSDNLKGFLMKFRHFVTLRTDFDTEECRRRLVESIDPEQRTMFSLSGYKGSKPVIGWIEGYEFYLHKRRYGHNDFAPLFHGNLLPQDRGTIIEGFFDIPRWTKKFWQIWVGVAILLGCPIFVLSLFYLFQGSSYSKDEVRVGLLGPPFLVLFGVLLPKVCLWFGRHEEQFILEFLQRTIVSVIASAD